MPLRQFAAASKSRKYEIPGLGEYSDLFNESGILDKLLPREISEADDFERAYPSMLKNSSSGSEVTGDTPYHLADINAVNKSLHDPAYDLLDRGGKRWRPVLGLIMAKCLGRENLQDFEANRDIYFSCGLTEIVHNGSLIIDDIEDGSSKRRGQDCTYKTFGTDIAINAGNFMYFSPMLKIDEYVSDPAKALALHKIYGEEMTAIHFGQGWDIYWHNQKNVLPSASQYYQMVENKTSCLPRMTLRMISELTGQDIEKQAAICRFVNMMGSSFQIMDDVLAVESDSYRKERGAFCEDIQEGKRTLMVIHSYYYGWKGDRLLEILNMKTSDEALHKEAVEILQSDEAVEFAKNAAKQTMLKAWKQIDEVLPDSEGKEDLHTLTNFLVNRSI